MAIRLEHSTTAKCRPEHIWQKFENLEQWAWWNRVVGPCKWTSGQPWQKGSRFLMELVKPRSMTVECTVLECAPPGKVAWVGSGFGWKGEHWFAFEAQPDGTTLLRTWEDLSGFVPMFFGDGAKKRTVDAYAAWLDALKVEAERMAREELARS